MIIYIVKERELTGRVSSTLYTESPYLALAEMMLKAKIPMIGRRRDDLNPPKVLIDVKQGASSALSPYVISMKMRIFHQKRKIELSEVIVETKHISGIIEEGFSRDSLDRFHSKSYMLVLKKIANKIEEWVGGDVEVAKVLSAFSSRDPHHLFWSEIMRTPKGYEFNL